MLILHLMSLGFKAVDVVYVRLGKVFPMRFMFIKVLKSIFSIDTIRCLSTYSYTYSPAASRARAGS